MWRWLSLCCLFVACAHAPEPASEPEPPTVCEAVPSMVATRRPKPAGYPQCGTNPSREAYKKACDAGDVDDCYRLASCLVADGMGLSPEEQRPRVKTARELLKAPCAAGMADACVLRAGAAIEAGTPAKDTCEDLIRASQLGSADAQLSCMGACLL